MTTPILRQNQGAAITRTYANSVANNAYSNSADSLRVQNTANALMVDFQLTGVSFATAPVGGTLQLVAVDRDTSGNQGPTPSATLQGKIVGNFMPTPQASNASTGWIMTILGVQATPDTDYWIFNNGTAYTLNSGCILAAQLWTPGT
jgi:hypothetical protein